MWLDERFHLCPVAGRALVLQGGEEYGAPFLVDRLRQVRSVAWLSLSPADADDPIAVGNRLAAAVNAAVGGNLLQQALPYLVHLRTLRLRREQLPDFTMVVSGAELVPDLSRSAIQACRNGFGLWLLAGDGLDDLDAVRLGPAELRLTWAEARQLTPSGIGDEQVQAAHASSDGAYSRFLSEIHRRAGLPDIVIPQPNGWAYPEQQARREDPDDVIDALLGLGRVVDALEIAAEHRPERVEDLLEEAGPEYQQQGLLMRLHTLLAMLPAPFDTRERTLEWRLVASHEAGSWPSVRSPVRRHLERYEAPNLRARYAAFIPYAEGLKEAGRAARDGSSLTLWQYGRMHPDPRKGISLLTRSVTQSELEGDAYASVRAAGSLAMRLSHVGDFPAAKSWAAWGLQLYDESGLRDGVRRLRLFNELAFARIMLGELSGLREQLQDHLATLENVLPEVAAGYRSALADIERLEGDPAVAVEYTRANLDTARRSHKGLRAYQHVRSLLELGRLTEAADVARAAVALSAGTPTIQDSRARLALGMVQAFREPDAGCSTLQEVMERRELVFEQRAMAALHYLMIRPEGLDEVPEDIRRTLKDLGEPALRVLSGPPEHFRAAWIALAGKEPIELDIKVLGRTSARLRESELRLTRRQWEILVALALHPQGMSYGELHAFLLQDDDRVGPSTIRSHVSYLRNQVPVSDSPYRIAVRYRMDLAEARSLLAEGKLREAMSLVRGGLLPQSSMPGIRSAAEQLEGALRESVLSSGDPEALYSAAALWEDDLEVCEACLASLHPRDPRLPLLKARVQTLRREYDAA